MIAERIAQPIHFNDRTGALRPEHAIAAYFDDYDGADDTPAAYRIIGYGRTRFEALCDLLLSLED